MPPAAGVAGQQRPHPVDAGRVQPVGGLVEHQHLRVTEEGVGDAEPLPHPERVVLDPAAGLLRGERHRLQHLVHPRARQVQHGGAEGQHLASGPPGVLGRGVEQHADVTPRVRDVAVGVPPDRGAPAGRRGEPGHHAHRRRLAGAVGPQEAGDPARCGDERDVVDGGEAAVGLGQSFHGDHGTSLLAVRRRWHRPRVPGRRDAGRGSGDTQGGGRPAPSDLAWAGAPPRPSRTERSAAVRPLTPASRRGGTPGASRSCSPSPGWAGWRPGACSGTRHRPCSSSTWCWGWRRSC